mmetsp:Transcript_49088/g.157228  ORF Transcript_49088/g.157228 Transcript_49088/m.157228 type:complete len:215 (-) Transcript_49088:835-1479(-)
MSQFRSAFLADLASLDLGLASASGARWKGEDSGGSPSSSPAARSNMRAHTSSMVEEEVGFRVRVWVLWVENGFCNRAPSQHLPPPAAIPVSQGTGLLLRTCPLLPPEGRTGIPSLARAARGVPEAQWSQAPPSRSRWGGSRRPGHTRRARTSSRYPTLRSRASPTLNSSPRRPPSRPSKWASLQGTSSPIPFPSCPMGSWSPACPAWIRQTSPV